MSSFLFLNVSPIGNWRVVIGIFECANYQLAARPLQSAKIESDT